MIEPDNLTTPTWRKTAIAAGILFLVTDFVSVVALVLYTPILNSPTYITGPGPDGAVLLGALFELIVAMAIVGTAVALFPLVRRQNEGIALGYVGLRTLEAGIIVTGVISLLAVVTLRQDLAGSGVTDASSVVTIGKALVALHNWTFLIGPGLTSGTDTVLLAYLMYRTRLVPRLIPILGLVGGPLVFVEAVAVLFGAVGQFSTVAAVTALPEALWELSLATWLIVRGFQPSALQALVRLRPARASVQPGSTAAPTAAGLRSASPSLTELTS